MSFFPAARRDREEGGHLPAKKVLPPGRIANVPGSEDKQGGPCGTRTRTPFRAEDFKSPAYAIPPRGLCFQKNDFAETNLESGANLSRPRRALTSRTSRVQGEAAASLG